MLEKFINGLGDFIYKTHQTVFRSHYVGGTIIVSDFRFVFEEARSGATFSKCFSSTRTDEKSDFSHSSSFKALFSWRICSVNDRPDRRVDEAWVTQRPTNVVMSQQDGIIDMGLIKHLIDARKRSAKIQRYSWVTATCFNIWFWVFRLFG